MATLAQLVATVDDPEDDSTEAYELVAELVAAGDRTLLPALTAQLDAYLDEGHFYGRDVIADVLAGLFGAEALPLLVRASSRDLGDDQDGLATTIIDVVETDRERARAELTRLAGDPDPRVRATTQQLLTYLAESAQPRAARPA